MKNEKLRILKLTLPPLVGFERGGGNNKTEKLGPKSGFTPNSQFTFTIPPSRN